MNPVQTGMLWHPRITYGVLLLAADHFREQLGEGRVHLALVINPDTKFSPEEQERISKELDATIQYDREVPSGHVWCPARSQPA